MEKFFSFIILNGILSFVLAAALLILLGDFIKYIVKASQNWNKRALILTTIRAFAIATYIACVTIWLHIIPYTNLSDGVSFGIGFLALIYTFGFIGVIEE